MSMGFSLGLFKQFLEGGSDEVVIPEDTIRKMGEHFSILRVDASERSGEMADIRATCARAAKKIGQWEKQSKAFPGGQPADLMKMRQRYETILAPFSLSRNRLEEKAILSILDLLVQNAVLRKTRKRISRNCAYNCLFRLLEAIETPKCYRGPHEWHNPYSDESLLVRLKRNQPRAWAKLKNREPLAWNDFNPPVVVTDFKTGGQTTSLTFRSEVGAFVPLSKPRKAGPDRQGGKGKAGQVDPTRPKSKATVTKPSVP